MYNVCLLTVGYPWQLWFVDQKHLSREIRIAAIIILVTWMATLLIYRVPLSLLNKYKNTYSRKNNLLLTLLLIKTNYLIYLFNGLHFNFIYFFKSNFNGRDITFPYQTIWVRRKISFFNRSMQFTRRWKSRKCCFFLVKLSS